MCHLPKPQNQQLQDLKLVDVMLLLLSQHSEPGDVHHDQARWNPRVHHLTRVTVLFHAFMAQFDSGMLYRADVCPWNSVSAARQGGGNGPRHPCFEYNLRLCE